MRVIDTGEMQTRLPGSAVCLGYFDGVHRGHMALIEAARDLGANGSQVFGRVILPMSVPGIISGITMVFIPSISTFIISKILGGGKDFLIGDLIEDYFLGNSGVVNYNIGAALSLVIMVMILAATFIMNHFDKDAQTSGGGVI